LLAALNRRQTGAGFSFFHLSKWPANGLSTAPAVFFLFGFHFYVDWYLFSTRKLAKNGQKTWAREAAVVLTLGNGMGSGVRSLGLWFPNSPHRSYYRVKRENTTKKKNNRSSKKEVSATILRSAA